MHILPNRNIRARETVRGIARVRADARRTTSCRCRQCGFVAFRALEHCPACGRPSWPFEPLPERTGDARTRYAVRSFDSWSARVARALRNASFRRPSASTAPLLSIATVVLLVGGYVATDRMCRADPTCRPPGASRVTVADAHASDNPAALPGDPSLPVLPVPVYPFHSVDAPQLAIDRHGATGAGAQWVRAARPAGTIATAAAGGNASLSAPNRALAARACTRHADPACPHATPPASVRTAVWHSPRDSAHRSHALRRVSAHGGHGRRHASNTFEIAKLYRGH
ncbi:hypothetical protein ACRS8P_07910 [Burkholderia cenocepacia]|uniref:ATP-dependent serine protease n=1 Tax=Burkholderia pseudomultivorans TaxID=1207504 RepID=A0A132EXJ0_9BURK|nr:hypothetical protein [Burkholderia pseudomultivorans]KVG65346.1 hypothetical protein WS80_13720 [Burkholderia pseudomultivorans]KWF62880.1 hypothetical protein WT57_23910 [Burkholderia pseudomultivorans]